MSQVTLEQAKGTDRDYTITLMDDQGNVATGFSAADSLTATIWSGGTSSSLVSPSAVWIDASAGTIKLTVSASNLSSLDPQPYPIRLSITHGGRTILGWQGWLNVVGTPGSSADLPVYCSYRDMLDFSGEWLNRLMTQSSYSGFQRERARARETLDGWILARYRPRQFFGATPLTVSLQPWTEGPDPTIKGYLDSNYLIVSNRVKRITAYLALHYVCSGQHEEDYARLAALYARKATSEAAGYVAEIDTNADGYPEYSIAFGTYSTRVN